MPVRSARACSTWADRSAEWMPDRPPFRLPVGVRTASTMTASRMGTPVECVSGGSPESTTPCHAVVVEQRVVEVTAEPRRAATAALVLLAVALAAVAVVSDPGGRVLAAPAALVALGLAVRDLVLRPVLQAGPDGLTVVQGV